MLNNWQQTSWKWADLCMGECKYVWSIQTYGGGCRGHTYVWGMYRYMGMYRCMEHYRCMGAYRFTGAYRYTGGCTDVWGVHTYGDIQMYMGAYEHMGNIQIYMENGDHMDIPRHIDRQTYPFHACQLFLKVSMVPNPNFTNQFDSLIIKTRETESQQHYPLKIFFSCVIYIQLLDFITNK